MKKVGVPPDFKGSAEIIRIVGNKAAHEEEFSEFEAGYLMQIPRRYWSVCSRFPGF